MHQLDEHKKAIKMLETTIQEDENNKFSWFLLAKCGCKLKKYIKGDVCLKKVRTII
jgi:cytochrome c-type biogenesis protein CcmH/NrfG